MVNFVISTKQKVTMSKSTNFTGPPLFGQLIKFINRHQVNTIAKKVVTDR
jgi:hypothetical protein